MDEICLAWEKAINYKNKPTVILFRTLMMKGCQTYENIPGWHGRPPKQDECCLMLKELGFNETYQESLEYYKREDKNVD